ncbi:MAG TPA: histidine kinase [Pyrinomonadaceae bacterium]|nr:histidine kinase [Pyrinomonadaceae bacterium]
MNTSPTATVKSDVPRGATTRRRRLPRWGLFAGFWLCFGLLNASQLYLGLRMENFPVPVGRMFATELIAWGAWAPLTAFVLWLGRRFPLERSALARGLLVHVPACLLVAAAHLAFFEYVVMLLEPFGPDRHPRPFGERFLGRATSQLHIELLIYAATLGLGYAVSYYARFRERERRASQLEAQLAQAQLQALKMQLHPHFLFNTLNGIAGLVRDNKNRAAVDMLAGLSDLLRYTLENAGKQEVPLKEELEFLELYLGIQQMRFPDRLRVEMRVAPETLDALVPNLILQPLVENAIRHGISKRATPGTVGVQAERDGEHLRVNVYDDGPGLKSNGGAGGGVGLSNTRERLQQLYGERQRFTLAEREGGGVEAALAIPFVRAESE